MEILDSLSSELHRGNEGRKQPLFGRNTFAFYFGLSLICASTLMYEVVLTRLLSVISWYYLAFVSISMATFGMTVGALFVQLSPTRFTEEQVPDRLAQVSLAMAVSMPLVLMTMLAVPVDVSRSIETVYSFAL